MTNDVFITIHNVCRPQPDKPVNIKCECRDAKIQLGDTLKHDVIVSFSDQYGNKIVKVF